MNLKSRFHSWLCVWLCCVLSAMVPSSPILLAMLAEEMRVAETEPADATEEVAVGEVTLSESNTGHRRQRREQVRFRATLAANHRLCGGRPDAASVATTLAGQGSLRGRCGPLHC